MIYVISNSKNGEAGRAKGKAKWKRWNNKWRFSFPVSVDEARDNTLKGRTKLFRNLRQGGFKKISKSDNHAAS